MTRITWKEIILHSYINVFIYSFVKLILISISTRPLQNIYYCLFDLVLIKNVPSEKNCFIPFSTGPYIKLH